MSLLRPCIACGELSEQSRCPEHKPAPRPNRRTDTGTTAWIKLSRQARRLQGWCLICSSTRSLAADHSPRAWARLAAGLPLRLVDVNVLCQLCNNAAGPSGEDTDRMNCWLRVDGDLHGTGPDPSIPQGGKGEPSSSRLRGEAKFRSQLGMTPNKGSAWQG